MAAAKGEVSRSWSDGPGLEPAAAAAPASESRAAGAGARAGFRVVAGAEPVRVSCQSRLCRKNSNSAGAFQAGGASNLSPGQHRVPPARTARLGFPEARDRLLPGQVLGARLLSNSERKPENCIIQTPAGFLAPGFSLQTVSGLSLSCRHHSSQGLASSHCALRLLLSHSRTSFFSLSIGNPVSEVHSTYPGVPPQLLEHSW